MGSRDGFSDNILLDNFGYRRSNPTGEQLSTRLGYGRVHSIIENILDKCEVIAPNLPTKTDDLSHSTGHRWTTREKVVNG
uniref:OSJNBa0008A08.4 protein n=2 Tax=Oryza sativa TaxID=4530 RepID=Q7XLC2_ORYSJ|nr:OSJNBa0008A08.4 [Oryza sativa Japonica Group]CAE05225.3 OSJNBa0011K22.7 [Oryza sativa Japonica Group]CAH66580.1 OSIGBa0137O04.6 [Oryza sativa]